MPTELLHLPFQNSALDTGPNKYPVLVQGGRYEQGRVGRSIRFSAAGKAEVLANLVPLNGTWTLRGWVKAERVGPFPTATWALFYFSNNEYLFLDFGSPMTSWQFVTIIQDESQIYVKLNDVEVSRQNIPAGWGKPTGFAVVNDNPITTGGYVSFEDVSIYSGVLSTPISIPALPVTKLAYFVNGVDFASHGVFVSESTGVIDNLNRKDGLSAEWPDYHGEVVDLSTPRYGAREISLNCFIRGVNKDEFLGRVQSFLGQFQQPGTQRLMINVVDGKPLLFEVYLKESVNLKKRWSSSKMIGTFEIKLREPQPVKRVLLWSGPGTVSITLTSSKLIQVYWGNGKKSPDIYGTARTITHTYTTTGNHYIILAGVIEDITGFSTTATTVWNLL